MLLIACADWQFSLPTYFPGTKHAHLLCGTWQAFKTILAPGIELKDHDKTDLNVRVAAASLVLRSPNPGSLLSMPAPVGHMLFALPPVHTIYCHYSSNEMNT